jgi:Serine aminopeptidase, S33
MPRSHQSTTLEVFKNFPKGHRFGLWVLPAQSNPCGVILGIQTPGEENNLSRRVMVQAAHRFAESGFITLLFDPYGIGDSAGLTSQARLQDWRSDLMKISHTLRLRYDAPFFMWGSRLGTLLAADLLISQSDTTRGLLLWAPMAHGRTWVDQLSRGANLSQVLSKSRGIGRPTAKPGLSDIDADTVGGPPSMQVDIPSLSTSKYKVLAGTSYRDALIEEIRHLSLLPVKNDAPLCNKPKIALLGVSSSIVSSKEETGRLSMPPALSTLRDNWMQAGYEVHAQNVRADPYWSSLAEVNPLELYEASEDWLLAA